MPLIDLVKDSPDSKLSSSRFWFNIANVIATIVYGYICFKVAQSPEIDLEGLAWYTLVYMGVVTGNKFANKFLTARYSAGNSEILERSHRRKRREEYIEEEPDNAHY